jgi:SAM-dependent methyltransferase
MKTNKQNPYDIEIHIAEIYDKQVNHTQDVDFIKNLALSNSCFRILEPFCGTGRILIPLAQCGLDLTGIDGSKVMVQKLIEKLQLKSNEILHKPNIICSNALDYKWETNYDLIILGANSFFELATLDEQEKLMTKAYDSLKDGGYLFIDNDNIENELPDYWCEIGIEKEGFPNGTCDDDIQLRSYVKPIYVDKQLKI